MTRLLELTLFGSPVVRYHGQPVTGFRSSKAQALLYYLAVTGRSHMRPTLAGLFWGDQPEESARTSLSKCLSNLRDLVGEAVLVDRQTIAFNHNRPYQLDTEHFLAGIAQSPTPETIASWQAALALYRGDFLEGFYVRDAPEFEQWVLVQRAHYREAVVQGLYTLANYFDQQGDLSSAITYTRRLLTLEPWREEAHRQLMTRLARSGQRAAALAQFETCRKILDEELAVEPDAETLTLVEVIRQDKVTRWQGDKVNAMQDHLVTNHLPIPPTALIGRERELTELGELIRDPQCRLVTIIGAGGMGKTRLALAAAAEQGEKFQHGAAFVALAGVFSAQFLPQAILNALNVPLRGDLSPQQQVRALLSSEERLLVLDNYEQLLPDVELLIDLLSYASKITLLVTSRERLALQAEHLYELGGLDYLRSSSPTISPKSPPDPGSFAAVQLFLQRVRQIQPRFVPNADELQAIVRICRISEGMPLGLELAAAAVREQSCVTLAAMLEQGQARLATRLRDLPERHRTMEAVFEHSWCLLSAAEQQVLAALSVFRGGFEIEAAQTVANATPAILVALLDKSWLRRNPNGRYHIHELMRQYASQQLVESGEFGVVQHRYTTYFFKWSEEVQTGMSGRQPTEWMIRIEQDIDNLRATLKWLALHSLEEGLLMTCNLHWLWQSRGYLREGCDWFALMLAQDALVASIVRVSAYDNAGLLAIMANEIDKAELLLSQSLALHQSLDPSDPQAGEELASVLNHLGVVALYRGDYQNALQLCHQGLAIAQQCGSLPKTSSAFLFAGEAYYLQGSFEEARRSFEECCRINEARGTPRSRAYSYARLGHLVCALGDLGRASTLFAQGLRWVDECHDLAGTSMVLIGLARIAALCGKYERAAVLTAAKEEMFTVNPIMRYWPMERAENERTLALLHAHLDDATFATAWAKGSAMSVEQVVAYALSESPTL
ncbi:MAG: BTAD domain-containing putative transcriptional regulator [Caldilineaceae bacterium]